MLIRMLVFKPLGEAKVNQMHIVASWANTNQEIVWLDITMNEATLVDKLNSLDQLISKEQHSFKRKLLTA